MRSVPHRSAGSCFLGWMMLRDDVWCCVGAFLPRLHSLSETCRHLYSLFQRPPRLRHGGPGAIAACGSRCARWAWCPRWPPWCGGRSGCCWRTQTPWAGEPSRRKEPGVAAAACREAAATGAAASDPAGHGHRSTTALAGVALLHAGGAVTGSGAVRDARRPLPCAPASWDAHPPSGPGGRRLLPELCIHARVTPPTGGWRELLRLSCARPAGAGRPRAAGDPAPAACVRLAGIVVSGGVLADRAAGGSPAGDLGRVPADQGSLPPGATMLAPCAASASMLTGLGKWVSHCNRRSDVSLRWARPTHPPVRSGGGVPAVDPFGPAMDINDVVDGLCSLLVPSVSRVTLWMSRGPTHSPGSRPGRTDGRPRTPPVRPSASPVVLGASPDGGVG